MSVATEKEEISSERFALVRLTPSRRVTLSPVSGDNYQLEFAQPVISVHKNGVALTPGTFGSLNDGFWAYDRETQTLQVNLSSPPGGDYIIIGYYLFYTGVKNRYISAEATAGTSSNRFLWEARILQYPETSQSFANIVNGVFTIADTSVTLINEDGQFQEFLTDDDSFYQKPIDMWICINSIDNVQKVFSGFVTDIQLTSNKVTISVSDSFNQLNQTAYMGDDPDDCAYTVASFPDVNPRDRNIAIPLIMGTISRYKHQVRAGVPSSSPVIYQLDEGNAAICTDFSTTISTSTNREWGLCRSDTLTNGSRTLGTLSAVTTVSGFIYANFSSVSANVKVGDSVSWVESAVTYYGRIGSKETFVHSTVTYNLVICDPSGAMTLSSSSFSAMGNSVQIIIDSIRDTPTRYYPIQGRDYTVSETSLDFNKFISITFTNNFEANHTGLSTVSPDYVKVSYKIENAGTYSTQSSSLKNLLTRAGLTVNAASFTAAQTDLPVNVQFQIPNFDEFEIDSYLKYAQDLLTSTLGYLSINNSFEVEYHIIQQVTGGDTRDRRLMIDGNTQCSVNYQDIVTRLISYNPHYDSQEIIDLPATPSVTAESLEAFYLHGINNTNRFRHVLDDMTDRIEDHIALKSMRSAIYTFSTATQDIDTVLGDEISLENKIVLGSTDTSNIKIISITKSPGSIQLRGSDFKGL